MGHRDRSVCLALAIVTLYVTGIAFVEGADPRADVASRKQRRVSTAGESEQKRRELLDLHYLRDKVINDRPTERDFDASIIRERVSGLNGTHAASDFPPPPPSPGIPIGMTIFDYQHNQSQGHQVGSVPGHAVVHFCWTAGDYIYSQEGDTRHVAYSSYTKAGNGGSLNQPFGGVGLAFDDQRGGYVNLSYTEGNESQLWMNRRALSSSPYHVWHYSFPTPGSAAYDPPIELGGTEPACTEVLWPHGDAAHDLGSNGAPLHVLAHDGNNCSRDLIWYWRFDGANWIGPAIIDSNFSLGYVVCDDPNSDKVAAVLHTDREPQFNDLNNIAYYESATGGLGWLSGAELGDANKVLLTNYTDDTGPHAWLHISAAYDNLGALHIVYDEQAVAHQTADVAIRHWNSDRNTIRPVALGYWDSPLAAGAFNLNLAKITMGIGDGATMCQSGAESNADYVYVLYTQYGGPTQTEQEDASLEGLYNGELYLAVSSTRGFTWAAPVNLTNTKTPKCNPGPGAPGASGQPPRPDSVCRSEAWSTINKYVHDIDILFISDLDAGGIPQGEGNWQQNPVHYLRYPGGPSNPDAQHLCPVLAPNFEAMLTSVPECEYNASQASSNVETLTILNLGNATLTGATSLTDFPGPPTLVLQSPGLYSLPAGDPDIVQTVTMNANGATEGLYSGSIEISHNDGTEASPRTFPIDFFVFNNFFCPEDSPPIGTGGVDPNGPSCLALEIGSNGRFASQNDEGGLWRHKDSSSSIFDGSLLIAHGPQGPDTTVFLRFYDRETNGQFGFRAMSNLLVDADDYGTGAGYVTVTATMCTKDSVVGIIATWYLPQDYSQDEFVIAHYKVYRHNDAVAVDDLAIGVLIDANILPAERLGSVQSGAYNTGGIDFFRSLIWQTGADTVGHPVFGQNTATRFRGGVATPCAFLGSYVGNSSDDLQDGGGPTDGFLYNQLQTLAGAGQFADSVTDLYQILSLGRGESIAVGETLHYAMVYASDTISESSFKATIDAGHALATSLGLCGCTCPCANDPQCDGFISTVLDVTKTIDVAFRGFAPAIDQNCLRERTDVDCSGATNVLDVTRVIDVAFRGANPATEYCDPCL